MPRNSVVTLSEKLRRIRVIFEDEALLVVNKPPGLAVHGGAGNNAPTVLSLIQAASSGDAPLRLGHRIDRGTSGVLILAKSKEVCQALGRAWPRVEKDYLAVAFGRVASGAINQPLMTKDGKRQAATTAIVTATFLEAVEPAVSLVHARLLTGRLHQIRRHLQSIGNPVVLDRQYGDFPANRRWKATVRERCGQAPKHLLLHSWRLTFSHPMDGRPICVSCPPPPAWKAPMESVGLSREQWLQITPPTSEESPCPAPKESGH